MAAQELTLRQLNRATLVRQMLLERTPLGVAHAVNRLVGLQAQQAMAPFVGLWSRVEGFDREDLKEVIRGRLVVKATFLRATLHLSLESDLRNFRFTLQPMLSAASRSINDGRAEGLDAGPLVDAARDFLASGPKTFAQISEMLIQLKPEVDAGAMRYAVRTHLPMVQVPTNAEWMYPGNPQFTTAAAWLEEPFSQTDHLKELWFRYLAAFGPASMTDFQRWSAVSLKGRIEEFRSDLIVYRDGRRELFDLPQAVIPPEDCPVPVRFLPEYDNLLLSHDKRTRVIADEYRSRVFLPGLRVRSTFLVDGFVAGVWKVEKAQSSTTLLLEPFALMPEAQRRSLEAEGERLVRFIAPHSSTHNVRFTDLR